MDKDFNGLREQIVKAGRRLDVLDERLIDKIDIIAVEMIDGEKVQKVREGWKEKAKPSKVFLIGNPVIGAFLA